MTTSATTGWGSDRMGEEKYIPFSQRHGFEPPPPIQREGMSDGLRAELWNEFFESFAYNDRNSFRRVWTHFLKKPVDEYDEGFVFIREFFLYAQWHEVYDLIEFCLRDEYLDLPYSDIELFSELGNRILERNNSAYRIIGEYVVPIISEKEIQSIEDAMNVPFEGVQEHIRRAVVLFSDKENPDYRNSIKESISAVEAVAKKITGEEKSLNKLTERLNLHPAFKKGINELYNWTSQEGGIRHGAGGKMLDPGQDTARFMLVLCSAFVNYIIAEQAEG